MQIRVWFTGSHLEHVWFVCLLLCGFMMDYGIIIPTRIPLIRYCTHFRGPKGGYLIFKCFGGRDSIGQFPNPQVIMNQRCLPVTWQGRLAPAQPRMDSSNGTSEAFPDACWLELIGTGIKDHKGKPLTLRKSSHMKVGDIESENSFIMAAYRHIHLQKTVAIVAAPWSS